MDQPAIRFENVSKRFVFSGQSQSSFLESIISLFSGKSKKRQSQNSEAERSLFALEDVSFDVMPGQGFGIIGRNGAGKSTSLKMVARILQPTSGRITVNGRVSALLELGAGFHHDLTGRENIFLNAAILGLSEEEVNQKFDAIVEFSELGSYIDMPIKFYSSGMFMRLGFSVAIHVEPDILIVDEILAVGDKAFQTKCLSKILDLKRRGTTIMMVSHNMNQIETICTDLVWIEQGKVVAQGPTDEVISQYVAYSYQREQGQAEQYDFERVGDRVVELTAVRLLNEDGEAQQRFQTGDKMVVEMAYFAHEPVPNPEFGLAIFRQDGVHVNGPNTRLGGLDLGVVEGEGVVRYEIEALPLLPARYLVTTAVHDSRFPHCYDMHKEAYSFEIETGGTSQYNGLIAMPATWSISRREMRV